jgi:hypothetical protein
MKITRKQLRQIIKETIRENNPDGSEVLSDDGVLTHGGEMYGGEGREDTAGLDDPEYSFPEHVEEAMFKAFDARSGPALPPGMMGRNAKRILFALSSSGYKVIKKRSLLLPQHVIDAVSEALKARYTGPHPRVSSEQRKDNAKSILQALRSSGYSVVKK